MDVKRSKGTVCHISYHLVWYPKYRRHILSGQVADRLRELLDEIAVQYGCEVLACEVLPDHVHLFVSAPPKHSPANLAKLFKGIASRRLRQALPAQTQRSIWKAGTLWSPSCYIGTAGNVSAEVITRYIEQGQHI